MRVILLPDRETGYNAFLTDHSRHEDQVLSRYGHPIEFRAVDVAETKDLDENTILDLDSGNICGITIEHASERTDIPTFSYEQITA